MLGTRVKETTTTTGTGDITLAGAAADFQSFYTAFPELGKRFSYGILASGGGWEVGVGYLSASDTLVRERVRETSAGVASQLDLQAGTHTVICDVDSGSLPGVWPGSRDAQDYGVISGLSGFFGAGVSGRSVTADTFYTQDFELKFAMQCSSIMYRVDTVGAGKGRWGLYFTDKDGSPVKKIRETADVAVGSIGQVIEPFSSSVVLQPGFYSIVFGAGSSPTYAIREYNSAHAIQGPCGGLGPFDKFNTGWTGALTALWTDLPDSIDTSITATGLSSRRPYVFLASLIGTVL